MLTATNSLSLAELQVRLYGGDTYYQGGVEIYLNGTWGTICDDSWGIEEANVICRMLNFTEGALSTQCCGFYNGYGVANQIWLDDVHCVGDEQSIAECRHAGFGRHNCRHTEDVGVVCKHTPESTPSNSAFLFHLYASLNLVQSVLLNSRLFVFLIKIIT